MNVDELSPEDYVLEDIDFARLDDIFILKHSSGHIDTEAKYFFELQPHHIYINTASFTHPVPHSGFREVTVMRQLNKLVLTCPCETPKGKMCTHQAQALCNIIRRPELRIFFDEQLRHQKMRLVARDYGLEHEPFPDSLFRIAYHNRVITIEPRDQQLFAATTANTSQLKAALLTPQKLPFTPHTDEAKETTRIIVFSEHKYYKQYKIELYDAVLTTTGKIKTVLQPVDPVSLIWETDNSNVLKFYAAIARFQHSYDSSQQEADIAALKALVKNPLDLPLFFHNSEASANFNNASLTKMQLQQLDIDIHLSVDFRNDFYEVSGELFIDEYGFAVDTAVTRHNYFLQHKNTLHLIDNVPFLKVIDYFKKNHNRIIIHQSKFETFRKEILSELEHKIITNYAYLKPATKQQLEEQHFEEEYEQIIYLSDSPGHVLITPVVKYGPAEVPVCSKQKIYAVDKNGTEFLVARNKELELRFLAQVMMQHPDFPDQLELDCFYLPKTTFLDDGWFLNAFEEWQQHNITILGFNQLKENKRNQHKAKVSVSMVSGLDWFQTSIKLQYGRQLASLKHLHKAIRNKSKFVQLGDGTLGLLPDDWLERFEAYFKAGEISEEQLLIAKTNYTAIDTFYDQDILSEQIKTELTFYRERLSGDGKIEVVAVPTELNGTLRDYQHHGLNWLNFLDELRFGGCLADDMGLGKTIQIIAFILLQRHKQHNNTNLIVVPTTLLFNWEAEIKKFAPSIKVHVVHGNNRSKDWLNFDAYEVILTSYGTLVNDIHYLKKLHFNYIFLDESQNIKNPTSERYKAARQLQSRNKIVLTGTPVENNTYDLYGQLSFACPGLLGSLQHFREQYATPIDKFKSTQRAMELQQKVSPFILRRTKRQVAKELPDKTEIVIYCEMGDEQRKVYDYYKNEYRDFLLSKQEDDLMKYSMHVLKGLTVLRQICDSPALLKDSLKAGSRSSKIDTLIEEIETRAQQHKILVFSQFVSMLDLVKKELDTKNIRYQYLTGQTKNRVEQVSGFQNNEEVRVFLISLKAGGTGLNLTEADYVYIVDPWWNPAVENQAIDRCYRIGQQKNVVAVRLICPDTIEEKIMKLQQTKKELVSDLIKAEGAFLKQFTKTELVNLFS